jgi:hypothetical protein
MNSSEVYFEKIKGFKHFPDPIASPQKQLLDYCNQIIGSVERLHVDYKVKDDSRSASLADSDKKNLAKAVSGFANSGGGILIWGIQDKTLVPKPITDIQKFLSFALELSSQVTDPVVQKIDGEWLPSDTNSSEGFGVIHIPESTLPPHRVVLNQQEIKNHYYIRSGQSFVVASHTQLEDMFGRRPKPQVSLSMKIVPAGGSPNRQNFYLMLGIENSGRGVAKYPLLCVKVHKPYQIVEHGIDGNMKYGLSPLSKSIRSEFDRYGALGDIVIHSGMVHDVTAIKLEVDRDKPASYMNDLVFDYQIAAEGIRLIEDQKIIAGSQLWADCQKHH